MAPRHGYVRGTIARLLRLLDEHGPAPLDAALSSERPPRAAPSRRSPSRTSSRSACASGTRCPAVPQIESDDPRVRNLVVPPRSLDAYDALAALADEEEAP